MVLMDRKPLKYLLLTGEPFINLFVLARYFQEMARRGFRGRFNTFLYVLDGQHPTSIGI